MQAGKLTDEHKALIELLLQYPRAKEKGDFYRANPPNMTKEEMIKRLAGAKKKDG